ncbi:hypothetical protein AB0D87_02605 [Streptomyces sp. NPDC048342]|uniref:hypothetical protein n=1 Tax=unclassified Streptomyces TaxID=2593676 RepID=UPI00342C5C96
MAAPARCTEAEAGAGTDWATAAGAAADGPETCEAEADEPETDGPEADEPETDGPETDEPETDDAEADEAGPRSRGPGGVCASGAAAVGTAAAGVRGLSVLPSEIRRCTDTSRPPFPAARESGAPRPGRGASGVVAARWTEAGAGADAAAVVGAPADAP